MYTVQEPLTNSVFPPPCSFEIPAELHPGDPPANKATTNQNQLTINAPVGDRQTGPFSANAYHVPPARYAPKPHSYRYDDTLDLPPDTTPLPERCQFMFSDGRQCTMARSDIHPSLCRFHSEREDQLFGDPVAGGMVVGASFDLPELYSACRDLTTAAGVSRALAQVFRLLAQRRISRQEAATFAKLGQLLLQSISAARSSRESHDDQELSRVNKVADVQPEEKLPPVSAAVREPERHPVAKAVSASDSPKAVPPSPIDAADVPQTWVMRSPVTVAQTMSPPNSQASRNEHFRKSDSQALQNQQIQNLGT